MTTRHTVTINATAGDATKAAEQIAGRLRALGKVVAIGPEYTQTEGHKTGLLSVDYTVEDAPTAAQATVTEAPAVVIEAKVEQPPAVPPQPEEEPIPPELLEDSISNEEADDLPAVWKAKPASKRARARA